MRELAYVDGVHHEGGNFLVDAARESVDGDTDKRIKLRADVNLLLLQEVIHTFGKCINRRSWLELGDDLHELN